MQDWLVRAPTNRKILQNVLYFYIKPITMTFLYIEPGSGSYIVPLLILCLLVVVVIIPIISYRAGFKNGKREGERIQLQKQVDKLEQ